MSEAKRGIDFFPLTKEEVHASISFKNMIQEILKEAWVTQQLTTRELSQFFQDLKMFFWKSSIIVALSFYIRL